MRRPLGRCEYCEIELDEYDDVYAFGHKLFCSKECRDDYASDNDMSEDDFTFIPECSLNDLYYE